MGLFDIIFQEQRTARVARLSIIITLQKRIALFSDNGDDLCYIYQESTISYGCVMISALHSGLIPAYSACDTDETTFYPIFFMLLFDAVIWIQLPPSRNTHVSGSLCCNSSISATSTGPQRP